MYKLYINIKRKRKKHKHNMDITYNTSQVVHISHKVTVKPRELLERSKYYWYSIIFV